MEDSDLQDQLGIEVLRSATLRAASGALLLVLLVSAVAPAAAFAGAGSGGCTDSGNVVNCGSGINGDPGGNNGSTGGSNPGGGGATSQPQCPDYVPYSDVYPGSDGGAPPAGMSTNGGWYVNICATGSAMGMATGVIWVVGGQPPTAAPPDPATVGAEAASELRLPSPPIALSPSGTGYVNFAEWLSISQSVWHLLSTSATACTAGGCVTANATATPSYVTWSTGDGSNTVCNGPGTAYDPSESASAQSTNCSHTYTETSAGQPSPDGNPNDAAFTVTATITWTVTWTGPGGSGGSLPALTTRASTLLKVTQIESVNN